MRFWVLLSDSHVGYGSGPARATTHLFGQLMGKPGPPKKIKNAG